MSNDIRTEDGDDNLMSKHHLQDGRQSSEINEVAQVQPFSLGNQDRIARRSMPTFENIHERFIRLFRISMSTFLSRLVEIKATSVETCKYSEFIEKHKEPCNINLIKIKPLRATSLILLENDFVFFIVDNLFGGGGRFKTAAKDREFSPTELRIVQRILDVFFEPYIEAWAPVQALEYEYLCSEMNMQFANIAMMNEVVVTTTFTIEVEEKAYSIDLCIPYAALEPIRDQLSTQMQGRVQDADIKWIEALKGAIQSIELEVVASLGEKRLSLESVVSLKPGDFIPLDYKSLINVTIDDVPALQCRYGIFNKKHALKIVKFLQSNSNEYVRNL